MDDRATVASIREARARLDAEAAKVIAVRSHALHDLLAPAQAALIAGGALIFQRGTQLVRVARLDEPASAHGLQHKAGSVVILPVTCDHLLVALGRASRWVRYARSRAKEGPAFEPRNCAPPVQLARQLLAIAGEWQVPPLRGVIATPTLRADGSLLTVPGYDAKSGLYGAFEPREFPAIDGEPARAAALAALAQLRELFGEFEFAGGPEGEHASVALAALITGVVRHALPTAPAFGVTAYKPGSGKTTLARAIAQVVAGRESPVLAISREEAELRKCLLGVLLAGDACVLADNIEHPVASAALCAALTSPTYVDRVLGASSTVSVPTAVTWLLTGNHLEFVGDLTSRVLLCALDPQVEHPEERNFRRDLGAYISEHRGELVAAALTLPLAYLAAGGPAIAHRPSRYREWDHFVRSPLLWLGAADPYATQALIAAADPVRENLAATLHAWREAVGDHIVTVAELVRHATAPDPPSDLSGLLNGNPVPLRGGSAAALHEALISVAGERDGSINARRLGRYLAKSVRRIEGGLRLEDIGEDPLTHRRRYCVAASGPQAGTGDQP